MDNVNNPILGAAQPKSNIFTMPLKAKVEATEALRKKNGRSASVNLLAALILVGTYSVMFFYPQMVQYLDFGNQLGATQEKIATYETNKADLTKKRDLHKAAYDSEFKDQQGVLSTVFPETPDKIGVIRLLENFATNLNASYPPFEFNNITFESVDKKGGYSALPFQTTIRTSRANFDRFLELVKLSGNADPKSQDHIRLMDISNISLRYLGVDSAGKDLGVDFNVKMKAYSR